MTLRIVLPLPHRALSPNARQHWAAKARETKKARRNAWLMGLKVVREELGKAPHWSRARTRVTFYWPTNRRRDKDNAAASLKAYWDGIADAGIVADDAGLTHEPIAMLVDAKRPRVEVSVEPLEASEAA